MPYRNAQGKHPWALDAQAAAAVYASEAEIFQNIKVDGNTVSYETNEFNGLSRQQLRIAFQQILDNL